MEIGSGLHSFLSMSQPCLQYWPEPGRQQYGLMEVEFVSGTANEDLVARVFRVQNTSRVSILRNPRVRVWVMARVAYSDSLEVIKGSFMLIFLCLAAVPLAAGGPPAGSALPVPALVCLPGHA